MKFLFNGLPYFGQLLTTALNELHPEHSFQFRDTYGSRTEQLKFMADLPFSNLVFSLNGVASPSGSMKAVVTLKKKLILHWQGTDVTYAVEQARKGQLYREFIDYAPGYTDAPWMQKELQDAGIPCDLLAYKWTEPVSVPEHYTSLSAYTYMGEGKEELYGWKHVETLANEFPQVEFYIAGTGGSGISRPRNVHFLGWISREAMKELRETHPVFLRLPAHDGHSLSVMEALSAGNEVIWTMPHEQCRQYRQGTSAKELFESCLHDIEQRQLMPNRKNIEFARNNYDKKKVLDNFLNVLLSHAGR